MCVQDSGAEASVMIAGLTNTEMTSDDWRRRGSGNSARTLD